MIKLFKSISFLFLFLILMPSTSFAQFSLFGGISVPMGEFKGTSVFDNGFAESGFNLGLQYNLTITNSLSWTGSIFSSANGINTSPIEEQLSSLFRSYGDSGGVKVSGGYYYTVWFLSGPGLQFDISNNKKLILQAQGGLLYSKKADIKSFSSTYGAVTSTDKGWGFGLGVTGGIEINHIIISARYYYGFPKYGWKYDIIGGDVALLCFDIGYVF